MMHPDYIENGNVPSCATLKKRLIQGSVSTFGKVQQCASEVLVPGTSKKPVDCKKDTAEPPLALKRPDGAMTYGRHSDSLDSSVALRENPLYRKLLYLRLETFTFLHKFH